ncbi:hypothetical protein GGR53DRAFT_518643 [Hypoxylon sp. FL1150]|nr:hypothetical protein GGR53DRAFT_518643 [Hypoxylon sp. FL1150]
MDIFNTNTDYETRLTQLRQFISNSSLSREEVRYLRILLSESRLDIVGELPTELVIQVAKSLDLSDFAACTAVSRRWRELFLSSPVIGHFVNRFCPSFAYRSGGIEATPEEGLETLRKVERARRRLCINAAKYFQWKHESDFQLDPEYHPNHKDVSATYAQYDIDGDDPEPDLSCLTGATYSSGKVAWRPKRHIIVVDSFWSRTRKIFSAPTGSVVSPELKLLTMGNQLVVGSLDHLLVAWDHVRNSYQEKKLPGPVKYAKTDGVRVVVILYSEDIFLWEFSGNLRALATTPLVKDNIHTDALKQWQTNLRVVFHPTCSRTLFLASAYTEIVDSTEVLKRIVYEFYDTQHIKTFEIDVIPAPMAPKWLRTLGIVCIRKMMPHRRDIIGFFQDGCGDAYEAFVEFDMYTREFTTRVYEEFDHWEDCWNFGWPLVNMHGDLDFTVHMSETHYMVRSYQPGFVLQIGQAGQGLLW